MNLEHFVGPEMNEMLEHTPTQRWDMSKEHRSQLNELPMAKAGTIVEINLKVMLDYNPKYKINSCSYAAINHK